MARVALLAVPLLNTRFPPLNVALLAGELKAHGHFCKTFDLNIDAFTAADEAGRSLWDFRNGHKWESEFEENIYPKYIAPLVDGWLDKLFAVQPDIVGISVTPNKLCMVLAQAIKARSPSTKVIFGGPMCSKVMGVNRYFPNEHVDAVVSDEGERTIIDLVGQWERDGVFSVTEGVTLLVDGQPIYGGMREAIADLDSTALPDFSDFDVPLYRDHYSDKPALELPLYSSRGCVARCNFCMDYKMWSVNYRQKSPKRVVDEMAHYWRTLGVKDFIFIELVFNGRHDWLKALAVDIKARGLKFRFWSHGRIDRRLTPELLRELKEIGFWHFIFGMESASDRVLRLMRKGTNRAKTEANLRDCAEADVMVSTNIIVGYPGEEEFDFLQTMIFAVRNRKYIGSMPSITACFATPGTDLYEQPEKFGVVIDRARPDAPFSWTTPDGRNTPAVRERRRHLMTVVLERVRWRHSAPVKRWSWADLQDRAIGAVAELAGRYVDRHLARLKQAETAPLPPPPALTKTRLPVVVSEAT